MTLKMPENVLSYRNRVIQKISPYLTGETLLDAGCGDGGDDYLLQKFFKKIEGIDIQENENWKSILSEKLHFRTGNVENLDYPDNSFDIVIEKDMLHHAENPEKAIKELCRVAKKRIIIMEANRYNPVFYLHLTLLKGHNHFTFKKFKKLLLSTGYAFEIKRFSARVCPVNNKFFIDTLNLFSDIFEKLTFLHFFIEYNLGIIIKNDS